MNEYGTFLHQHWLPMLLLVLSFGFGFLAGYIRKESTVVKAIANLLNVAMTVPEANSRLVFLLQGSALAVAILAVSFGFLFAQDRSDFVTFLGVILGGGVGAAYGRSLTKKAGDGPGAPGDPAQK